MTKIHFITQGCSANQADSEIMKGLLKEKGISLVPESEAELIVFNTCTVKGPTESFFRKKIAELEAKGIPVVIAGCIPQADRNIKTKEKHSMIGTYQIDRIKEVVDETIKGNAVEMLEMENKPRLNLPRVRSNPHVEIVPILQGCLSSCTFCKTKHARGNLYSHSTQEIVRHISKAVKDGVREIWLTSQDNSVYGLDIGTNLPELLKEIVSIPREFKVRVGMANPKFILQFLDELIEVYKHDKIYKFLHVPLQSGSDKVLEDMKRGYKVEDYKKIIERFKQEIPDITISTDVICGFPTESREDFEKTLEVIRETMPDSINTSRFWARPGTPAARMKQIPGAEVNERSRKLTELFHLIALEKNKEWIGWKGRIIVTEKGKYDRLIGKNYAYKQVLIHGDESLLGQEVEVEVISPAIFDLRARILSGIESKQVLNISRENNI